MSESPNPTPVVSKPTSDEKLWIILSHLSVCVGVGLIVPLIVYLVKKDESAVIADHAKEALNFHITVFIAFIVSFLLIFACIGYFMMIAIGLGTVVLAIIAAIRASEGVLYRYPLTIRLVK